jgi:DNA-binding MarR family transcriptional regulator/N-acetylglutamate synthase-like GNAT family acetyltransferase
MGEARQVSQQRISTVREFNRFYTQRIGVLREGLLDTEYSLTEVRVLYEIANRENALANDLVRELGLDAGYLSRILARFQQRGWIKRERSATDARKSHLRPTAKGRKVFASLDRRARDEISGLLAPLPVEQQERLQGHLQNVQTLLSATPQASATASLREHRPGDIGWIIQRHGVLYAQQYGWTIEFEGLVAGICAKFVANFDAARERCWIAQKNGVPVGCIMLVRHSSTVAKLRLLLVEPTERGSGVGTMLVAECLNFARAAGYRNVTLWTQSILSAARRLYEAAGFKRVKSEPHTSFGAKLVGETWELSL